jgi:hypothetical protein
VPNDRPDFGPKGRAEAVKRFGQPADHDDTTDEPTEPTEPTRGAAGAAEAIRRHPTQQNRA